MRDRDFKPLSSADKPVIPVESLSLAIISSLSLCILLLFLKHMVLPSFLPSSPLFFWSSPLFFPHFSSFKLHFFPLHILFFSPPCSLFLLALSFSLAFISTSYRITVRLGEYNEAVPLQLQTFPSPVCQGSKTNPWQIFWHSDTREDVCNDSKHSDSSSTKTKKK